VADDVEQQAPRHDDATRLVHVGEQLRAHRELHVRRRQEHGLLGRRRLDQDARQDLDARALRHAATNNLKLFEKIVLGARDAHGQRSLDGSAAHTATPRGGAWVSSSLLFF
jgi:hypothetical protein